MNDFPRLRFSCVVLVSCWLATCTFGPFAHGQQASTVAPSLGLPETDEGLPGSGPIRRQDWFKNVWKKRRATFASQANAQQQSVVFLGDSITQGWSDNFRGDFGDLKVANRGISGDTTRGMLIRLEADVLALDPTGVVLLMGTNDLEEKAEPPTIAANVELILEEIHKHDPDLPIVICLVFPSSAKKSRPADKISELNRLYRALAKSRANVTVVDTWTLFADESGDAKPAEFPDLLHPNGAGYAKWKLALIPIFATLGFVETASDPFEIEDGFESLFNGTDLTGWGLRPTSEKMRRSRERWQGRHKDAPPWPLVDSAVSFQGKASSDDGRFRAIHGRLVVTTPPEGRRIQQLWTTREFGSDFVLRLEFRATPNADSGIFIREPQLQCRDYLLAGPYKKLAQYRAQDWNEIEIDVTGGVARCTCNGELLEAEFKVPASGPIGLEGDRGQIEYRRIRVKMSK